MKDAKIETWDGVEYECEEVHYKAHCVGYAPTKAMADLDDMLGSIEPEDVFVLAKRQLKQDAKNAVRKKFQTKLSAGIVNKAIEDGRLVDKDVVSAIQLAKDGKFKNWTEACMVKLGLGVAALDKVDPKKIHWDIL